MARGGRLHIPDRARIHARLARANRGQRALFVVWSMVAAASVVLTRWEVLAYRPLVAVIAVAFGGGGTLVAAVLTLFQNRRWVEDIAPDRVLGRYRRDDLIGLVGEVHRRLGIPGRTPLAVTGDKNLNASAMNFGMAWLFPKLNAVFLHRPMLHVLSREELAAVIGHELGHYHRYKLDFARALALHLVTLVPASLALVSWLPDAQGAELFGVALLVGAHRAFVGALYHTHQRAIEYMCDEAGVEAGGAVAHVNLELKLALEAETTLQLQAQLLREGGNLPVAKLMELYEEAMPFSRPDPEELARRVRARVASERERRRGLSLLGFFEYVWGGVSADDVAGSGDPAARAALQAPSFPVLAWDRERFRAQGGFDAGEIDGLVAAMKANPELPLFRLVEDLHPELAVTHPSPSQRILYVWEGRG